MAQAGELLSQINFPSDLRKLPKDKLPQLCKELREFIIHQVAETGGHFGASLGVVELTVALHYVFNTPHDLIVWDVGHQAYGHKILTGRREHFKTLRQFGGLSGFPKRDESEYDTFGVGHSSTSISAALGMAVASKLRGIDRHVVAVIGDGALTAGLAYEGLNNAGAMPDVNLLIILNDNSMSIDPNVGAITKYLTDLTTWSLYNKFRNELWNALGRVKEKFGIPAQEIASAIEHKVKNTILKGGNLFEALGIRYFGPEDGHDVLRLVEILEDLKKIKQPRLLHIKTVKGKGYKPAEENQVKWHSTGKFIVETGEPLDKPSKPSPPKYQEVFGHTMIELMRQDDRIVAITPAMLSGSSLTITMKEFPDRVFDVGIAEQHAVTFAAGLATQGMKPVVAIYSTFLQRAYDQAIHDVAIQKLHVVFAIDRAGLVGADGPTHHGAFDIAYLRPIPNFILSAPLNESELRDLLYTALQDEINQPFAIRYPRGKGVLIDWRTPMKKIPIGKGELLHEGEDVAILAYGHPGNFALKALETLATFNMHPALYNMRFAKPLDEELLHQIFSKFNKIITVEDGSIIGGFGSAILEFMNEHGYNAEVVRLGIPDKFITHGSPEELHRYCGYDAESIIKTTKRLLEGGTRRTVYISAVK